MAASLGCGFLTEDFAPIVYFEIADQKVFEFSFYGLSFLCKVKRISVIQNESC